MSEIDRLARVIADEIGQGYDLAYENKAEWIDDRGKRGDINQPFKADYRNAARATLQAIREPTFDPETVSYHRGMSRADWWRAMIDRFTGVTK